MKKYLASGMFVFLSVCATLTANDIKEFCEKEKEKSEKNYKIMCSMYQDKEPPDLFEIHEIGYWKGMNDAFSKILERL